jgi:20S proteasome subunit beta 2
MASNLELHSLSTGRKPRVVTVMTMLKQHLFRYQGHIGAYLVVAGCDPTGAHLFTVHAHGSTDKLPYVTMGSGSLAAMSVFETQWKPNMTREQAVSLCSNAIQAGIWNDLGSGSNVDVCVITKDKTELLRNYLTPNTREPKKRVPERHHCGAEREDYHKGGHQQVRDGTGYWRWRGWNWREDGGGCLINYELLHCARLK